MDIVYIRGLVLDASIGIYDWERCIQQKVRIDLEMAWDNSVPAKGNANAIDDCLNYKTVAKLVGVLVASRHYDLVEDLAEELAASLMRKLGIPWVKVRLGKPFAVKKSAEVGVQIERGQLS